MQATAISEKRQDNIKMDLGVLTEHEDTLRNCQAPV
jgi:hypothetical protein